jgi:hypothetical protein
MPYEYGEWEHEPETQESSSRRACSTQQFRRKDEIHFSQSPQRCSCAFSQQFFWSACLLACFCYFFLSTKFHLSDYPFIRTYELRVLVFSLASLREPE